MSILASDISPDGSKLVAIGNFTKVNGLDRYQIAVLDLTTSPISVADWQTNRYGDGCSRSFQSYMRDIDISPDGSYFAVATTGAYASPTAPYLCDTVARWELGATGSGLQPTWAEYPGGDTITEVAVTDTAVYVGGHYSYMNNPYVGDNISAGAAPARHCPRTTRAMASCSTGTRGGPVATGCTGSSRPTTGCGSVRTPTASRDGTTGGGSRSCRWRVAPNCRRTTPAPCRPRSCRSVWTKAGSGSTLDRTTSRDFTGSATSNSSTTAGTSTWRDVRGTFMVDGNLYTGWSDRTFKVQPYNGTTFGTQATVPLQLVEGAPQTLNRFATEDLADITGMFYDPTTARIYFTKSGSNQLHWRGFSSESRVVGAQRFSSPSGAGSVTWSDVRSMFMVDNQLYTSSSSGNLVRRAWNPATGLPTGSATTVSGPGIDGQDWRARDAFNYAPAGFEVPNTPPVASFTNTCTGAVCTFDATGSSDPDGSITSYAWDFGDSTSPEPAPPANHVYAVSGTFTVTLTVTDDQGATTTTTQQVEVQVPNVAPTADFTSSCTALTCTFDAAGSSDPDGTIASYNWNFGDGTSATGATANQTYTTPGSYTVTLTVTDNDGATNTKSAGVSVIDPNQTPTVDHRATASSNANTLNAQVDVPASVQAGDVMVLITTLNRTDTTVTGPDGWTLLDSASNATASSQTFAWTKRATAGDAGTTVNVTNSVRAKTSMQLLAYSGADTVSAHQLEFDTTSSDQRTTPTVPVTTPGSASISYWADKSNDSGAWALPGGVTERDQSAGSGNGTITAAIADTTGLGTGPAGGYTATSDSANRRGITWSIVVSPASGTPQNTPPTATFSASCAALSCTFDASGSTDPDGTITAHTWDLVSQRDLSVGAGGGHITSA